MDERDILVITDENGIEYKIQVFDIFSLDEYPGKEYIFYSRGEMEDDNVKTYISILEESEDEIDLVSINDQNELKKVLEYININSKEGDL